LRPRAPLIASDWITIAPLLVPIRDSFADSPKTGHRKGRFRPPDAVNAIVCGPVLCVCAG